MDEDCQPRPHPADLPRCHKYPPKGFTSYQEWRKYTHYTDRYVIGVGYASSTISQDDADAKALANAQLDAENRFKSLITPIGAPNLWPPGSPTE